MKAEGNRQRMWCGAVFHSTRQMDATELEECHHCFLGEHRTSHMPGTINAIRSLNNKAWKMKADEGCEGCWTGLSPLELY